MLLKRRRFFLPGFAPIAIVIVVIACALAALVTGCANNPVGSAQTLEQKAYAVYGTFVIVEEQGAKLVTDVSTPSPVRQAIVAADFTAKPTADSLVTALQQYEAAKTAISAGTSSADKLAIATANLNRWIAQATTDVNNLVVAVKSTASAKPTAASAVKGSP